MDILVANLKLFFVNRLKKSIFFISEFKNQFELVPWQKDDNNSPYSVPYIFIYIKYHNSNLFQILIKICKNNK